MNLKKLIKEVERLKKLNQLSSLRFETLEGIKQTVEAVDSYFIKEAEKSGFDMGDDWKKLKKLLDIK